MRGQSPKSVLGGWEFFGSEDLGGRELGRKVKIRKTAYIVPGLAHLIGAGIERKAAVWLRGNRGAWPLGNCPHRAKASREKGMTGHCGAFLSPGPDGTMGYDGPFRYAGILDDER